MNIFTDAPKLIKELEAKLDRQVELMEEILKELKRGNASR